MNTTHEKEPTVAAAAPETFDKADHDTAMEAEAGILMQVQMQHLMNRAAYLALQVARLEAKLAELQARTSLRGTDHA